MGCDYSVCKKISRCMMYCVFFILLFLMWAKPIEVNNDYTEVDSAGHIIRVNGKSFQQYLADQGVDIRDINIADKEFYLQHYDESIKVVKVDEKDVEKDVSSDVEKDVEKDMPSDVEKDMSNEVSSDVEKDSKKVMPNDKENTNEQSPLSISQKVKTISEEVKTISEELQAVSETLEETLSEESIHHEKTCSSTNSKDSHHHHHHHHHHHETEIKTEIREEDKHPYLAIFLTTVSAFAATLGGAFVVFCYTPSPTVLGSLLGFSAGIMLYISYMDIMGHAEEDFGENGMLLSNIWMFVGMVGFLLLSHLLPEEEEGDDNDKNHLQKTGWITALGISLHNFPEGLIVFNATVVGVCDLATPSSFSLSYIFQYLTKCTGRGLMTAIAIAIHNIPEGIAVALPIYCSTKSKKEALKWCLLSSIFEPLAAILFGLCFSNFITTSVMAAMNAMVAGIMIVLCLFELIPTALKYTNPKNVTLSVIVGQLVMFVSLYLLIEAGAH